MAFVVFWDTPSFHYKVRKVSLWYRDTHVCVLVCVWEIHNYKHFPVCYFTGGQYYLLVGKSHVVSRRDGDIILADDQSVSRRHAVITVEHNIKDLVRNYMTEIFH